MCQVVKILTAVLATALLVGCQSMQPTTAVVTVEKPTLLLPNVDQVKLNDVEWHVINKNAQAGAEDHIDTTFRTAHSDTLFAITPKDYEDMAVNQANLVKVIRQYQAQINAYKQYYDSQATTAGTTKSGTTSGSTN
jgi:hypothetical protein